MTEFVMPARGADLEAGTLVEWLKKPGDAVKRGDVVAVVDTQKGAIEIEIFEAGVLDRILVQPGEKVPAITVICLAPVTAGLLNQPSRPHFMTWTSASSLMMNLPRMVPSPACRRIRVAR